MSVLNCDAYDYLEIACLYGYQLEIQLKNGHSLNAKATNVGVVVVNGEKQECLLVVQSDQAQRWLPTKELLSLRVLTQKAKFEFVRF
tara:strand:- start:215 stop:475 length:261 start_codon:yes stop_codon:yes gene_type:complete